jgi:hypothetical protein
VRVFVTDQEACRNRRPLTDRFKNVVLVVENKTLYPEARAPEPEKGTAIYQFVYRPTRKGNWK